MHKAHIYRENVGIWWSNLHLIWVYVVSINNALYTKHNENKTKHIFFSSLLFSFPPVVRPHSTRSSAEFHFLMVSLRRAHSYFSLLLFFLFRWCLVVATFFSLRSFDVFCPFFSFHSFLFIQYASSNKNKLTIFTANNFQRKFFFVTCFFFSARAHASSSQYSHSFWCKVFVVSVRFE